MAESYRSSFSLTGWLRIGLGAYLDILRFGGRATRTEILCFMIVATLVQAGLDLLVQMAIGRDLYDYPIAWRKQPIGYAIGFIAWLPIWSLLVRRMHDYDQPAWRAIAFLCAFEALGLTQLLVFPGPDKPLAYILIATPLVALAWLLTLYSPTPGPNRYGPDPRRDPQPVA